MFMYGGTKTEMERLIKDASEMDEEMQKLGVTIDADDLSFGNIINSISVMQEHMKIAGTTQNEAAKTISGSIAMMKASWQNFLTGTGSPKEFADSFKTVFTNVSKSMKEIVPELTSGLGDLVKELSPEIPGIVQELLPSFISGGVGIITGLATAAPEIVTALKKSLPEIINQVKDNSGELKQAGKDLVSAILPDNFDDIPSLVTSATGFVTSFLAKLTNPENLKKVNAYAFDFIGAFVKGLTSEETLNQITDPDKGVFKIVDNIGQGLIDFADHLLDGTGEMLDAFVEYLSKPENVAKIQKGATDIITHLGEGLTSQETKDALGHFLVSLCQFIGSAIAAGGGSANAIDWENDVGGVIGWKILKGIYNSTLFGWLSKLGNFAGEEISDLVHELDNKFLNDPDATGSRSEYKNESIEKGNLEAAIAASGGQGYYTAQDQLSDKNIPDFVKEQMRKGMHATGFSVSKPTLLTNDVVGEDGEEVLLPLDKNTGWMDKFANKLDNLLNKEEKSYNQQDINVIDNFTTKLDRIVSDIPTESNINQDTDILDNFTTKLNNIFDKKPYQQDTSMIEQFITKLDNTLSTTEDKPTEIGIFDKIVSKLGGLLDRSYDPKDVSWFDRFTDRLGRLLDTVVTKPDQSVNIVDIDLSDYIKDTDKPDDRKPVQYDTPRDVDVNVSALAPDWLNDLQPVEIKPTETNWIQNIQPVEIRPVQSETDEIQDDSWIGKLADMLDSRINNSINITVNAESDKAQDIVAAIDEALRNRQIDQLRGIGGTAWT